jgi:hypothetical protein
MCEQVCVVSAMCCSDVCDMRCVLDTFHLRWHHYVMVCVCVCVCVRVRVRVCVRVEFRVQWNCMER